MSVETHAHHEHPDVVGSRNRLGVILLLVADISFALSMVFVYFYLRGQNVNDMWLPAATADRPAIEPLSAGPGWTVTADAYGYGKAKSLASKHMHTANIQM